MKAINHTLRVNAKPYLWATNIPISLTEYIDAKILFTFQKPPEIIICKQNYYSGVRPSMALYWVPPTKIPDINLDIYFKSIHFESKSGQSSNILKGN